MTTSGYGGEGPALMAVGWTESVLGMLVIALRLYGASKRAGEIKWDFVWIALAGFFGFASQITFALSIHYGMGNHMANLEVDQIVLALQWIWISIFLGLMGTVTAKWAIVALLLQLNGPNARKRKWLLWGLAATTGISAVAQFIISFTQCTPAAKLWNFTLEGACPNATLALNYGYFQCAYSVFVDIALAVYPISIVWNLQASTKMKLGFCLLMSGGIIPAAAGIAKTVTLGFLANPKDITYEFAPFMTLAATELWAVIILGSIPPLRPLFVRVFRRAASSVGMSGDRTNRMYGTNGRSGRSTRGAGGTGHGQPHQLQSLGEKSAASIPVSPLEKKLGTTYTSQVMTGMDNSSEEDMLRDQHGANMDQIVISTEYAVESMKRDSGMGRRPADRRVGPGDLEYGFGGYRS